MNLTSMLVLTTMFINVSNSLPKTSYMKMVDAWLLFNLLYPFIVVLLHTYMDTLRNNEEREINHHGKTITINEENDERISDDKIEVEIIHWWILTVFITGDIRSPGICEWKSWIGGTKRVLQKNRIRDGEEEIKAAWTSEESKHYLSTIDGNFFCCHFLVCWSQECRSDLKS